MNDGNHNDLGEGIMKVTSPEIPKEDYLLVNIQCRHKGCKGRQAYMVKSDGGHVTYLCTTCNRSWSLGVGGGVDF